MVACVAGWRVRDGRYGTGCLAALTAREHDVLALMAEGRSNSAIADHLVVSERAVERHISNIFSKLGLPPSDSDHRRVLAVLASLGTQTFRPSGLVFRRG